MEKKDIFQDIQNIRSSNPVIVLGSGASVSYGIPGMGVLANELKNFFKSNPYYDTATNDVVSDFIKLLDSGVGLEAACNYSAILICSIAFTIQVWHSVLLIR